MIKKYRKAKKSLNLARDPKCQTGDKEPIQVSQKVSFQRQNGRVVPENISWVYENVIFSCTILRSNWKSRI